MAITNMLTGVEYKLGQGTYSYAADIATGPIVIQRSRDNGASYENMTEVLRRQLMERLALVRILCIRRQSHQGII